MKNDHLKERIQKNREFQEKLSYSTDYIDWLEEFTESFSSFSTDSFLYDNNLLTEQDRENVSHLSYFFEKIYTFAENNYIPPHDTSYGMYYPIQYRGFGYSIGIDYGQGAMFYCKRMDYPEDDAIDYIQIMVEEKLPNSIVIKSKLDEFAKMIEELNEENVPLDSIERVFHDTMNILKKESKVKVKKKD